MTTKDEAHKALHEASLSIACLGADWTEHFEDESVTKNHQSALDSQREDDAIQYLQDCGVYPDPDDKFFPMEIDDD